MDIYCPHCAEPWDTSEFGYLAEELETTYSDIVTQFGRKGCKAFGQSHNHYAQLDTERADLSKAMFELLGDDVDGIAAMMEDAEALRIWEV